MKRLFVFAAAMLCAAPTLAQNSPPPVAMTLTPGPEPVPALRYRLLPDPATLTSGNAAELYFRSFSPEWVRSHGDWNPDKFGEQLDKSPKELSSLKEGLAATVVNDLSLREVDRGARRRSIDWGLWERVPIEGPALLLPELQGLRMAASAIALRSRVQIGHGDFEGAISGLQTNLALSRHLCDAPTLIHVLVGAAVGSTTCHQLEEWVRTPGSPNLYWALTDLPRPFLDFRTALTGERLMIDALFPGVRERLMNGDRAPLSESEIRASFDRAIKLGLGEGKLSADGLVKAELEPARKFLKDRGYSHVDTMPPLQAVLMYEMSEADRLRDELAKVLSLPFPDRLARIREYDKLVAGTGKGFEIVKAVTPAARFIGAALRIERRLTALRVVEAIRLHANSTGKLPASLAEVTVVPVPLDPGTEKPFDYKLDGPTATLSAVPVPTDTAGNTALAFTLTLGRK